MRPLFETMTQFQPQSHHRPERDIASVCIDRSFGSYCIIVASGAAKPGRYAVIELLLEQAIAALEAAKHAERGEMAAMRWRCNIMLRALEAMVEKDDRSIIAVELAQFYRRAIALVANPWVSRRTCTGIGTVLADLLDAWQSLGEKRIA